MFKIKLFIFSVIWLAASWLGAASAYGATVTQNDCEKLYGGTCRANPDSTYTYKVADCDFGPSCYVPVIDADQCNINGVDECHSASTCSGKVNIKGVCDKGMFGGGKSSVCCYDNPTSASASSTTSPATPGSTASSGTTSPATPGTTSSTTSSSGTTSPATPGTTPSSGGGAVSGKACKSKLGGSGSCKSACDANFHSEGSTDCSSSEFCCVSNTVVGGGAPASGGSATTPSTGGAGTPTASTGGGANVTFRNPLGFSSVEGFLGKVLSTLQGLIVTLALVFLVIGATLYIISGGNKERLGAGKAAMTAAVVGLAVALAAPAFLKEISDILGWDAAPAEVSGALSLSQIALNVLNFLLSTVGILAIIMLLIGGGTILTAAGSEDRIGTGKDIVKYAVIGIAIAFASLVIIRQIGTFFS